MAVGDTTLFRATSYYLATSAIALRTGTVWRAGLSSRAFAELSAGFSNPRFNNAFIPEVTAGGNYNAGGIQLNTIIDDQTAVESSGQIRLALDTSAHAEGRLHLSATTGNPGIVRSMIIYDSNAISGEAVMAIDLTDDGSTPVNLTSRDLSLYVGSTSTTGVFFTLSVV
jgi:hypothetical protein